MKKVFFILAVTTIFSLQGLCANSPKSPAKKYSQAVHLLDCEEYKNLTSQNIKSLKIIRYTEAGISEFKIDDKEKINQILDYLNRIFISDESKMSCEDNTTIYSFDLKDKTKVSVEIECNWVKIKGKSYNFKVLH